MRFNKKKGASKDNKLIALGFAFMLGQLMFVAGLPGAALWYVLRGEVNYRAIALVVVGAAVLAGVHRALEPGKSFVVVYASGLATACVLVAAVLGRQWLEHGRLSATATVGLWIAVLVGTIVIAYRRWPRRRARRRPT